MKICSKCNIEKPLKDFVLKSRKNPHDRRSECKECTNSQKRAAHVELRDQALEAYGCKCSCCSISERVFLAIDHVHDDGANHRRKLNSNSSATLYRWLRKNGYPKQFQVLCFNCNEAKKYGPCPHKLVKES